MIILLIIAGLLLLSGSSYVGYNRYGYQGAGGFGLGTILVILLIVWLFFSNRF